MSNIVHISIKNYRGIKELSMALGFEQHLICLIGRGDSCKTTILNAVSSALSPKWNLQFFDSDFYQCDYENEIEISVTIVNFSETLISDRKFGLLARGYDKHKGVIIDDVAFDESPELIPAITIKLTVDKSLEPKWNVISNRKNSEKQISANERARLNCFLVSDFIDSHFSWNKGNPLYSILRTTDSNKSFERENVLIQYLRETKREIDNNVFTDLEEVTSSIKSQAAELGLDISKANTTLDSRELSIKDGKISLHEDSVPFRLKGKGSKRLLSIAIQSVLVQSGGVMLIDEIEQGLEPDRIKQTIRSLLNHDAGQIFLTTHSRDAIVELGSSPLIFLLKNENTGNVETKVLKYSTDELQRSIRACPEAFFAKKVIVCEGATEVGICRAVDIWRQSRSKESMSFMDCAYIDGTGRALADRVNDIRGVGITTALLCDSDDSTLNSSKAEWRQNGVSIFDCENELCLEEQLFLDLPWQVILEIIGEIVLDQYPDETSFLSSVESKFNGNGAFPVDWRDSDTKNMRDAFANVSTQKEWFKRVDRGQNLGTIILKNFGLIEDDKHIKKTVTDLSNWIDV